MDDGAIEDVLRALDAAFVPEPIWRQVDSIGSYLLPLVAIHPALSDIPDVSACLKIRAGMASRFPFLEWASEVVVPAGRAHAYGRFPGDIYFSSLLLCEAVKEHVDELVTMVEGADPALQRLAGLFKEGSRAIPEPNAFRTPDDDLDDVERDLETEFALATEPVAARRAPAQDVGSFSKQDVVDGLLGRSSADRGRAALNLAGYRTDDDILAADVGRYVDTLVRLPLNGRSYPLAMSWLARQHIGALPASSAILLAGVSGESAADAPARDALAEQVLRNILESVTSAIVTHLGRH